MPEVLYQQLSINLCFWIIFQNSSHIINIILVI